MQQVDLQGNVWNLGIDGSESSNVYTSINYNLVVKISKAQVLLDSFYFWFSNLSSTNENIDNEVLRRIEELQEVLK